MGDIRIAACLMKPHGCRRNLCCLFGELRLGVRFDLLDIVPSAVNGLDGKNFQLETMVFHFFFYPWSYILVSESWFFGFWSGRRSGFFPHGGIRELFPGRMWPPFPTSPVDPASQVTSAPRRFQRRFTLFDGRLGSYCCREMSCWKVGFPAYQGHVSSWSGSFFLQKSRTTPGIHLP